MTKRDGSQQCGGCAADQASGSKTRSGSHIGTRTGTTGAPIPNDAYSSER